jgi:hypothetical protein
MSPSSKKSLRKNWLATIWDLDFASTLETWAPDGSLSICDYLVFGYEICPDTKRPHLQCYFQFKRPIRLSGLKKLHPTCNWTFATGTSEQNRLYCLKIRPQDTVPNSRFVEMGVRGCGPVHNGGVNCSRVDLDRFKDSVNAGILSMKALREKHSTVLARYPRFCREYVNDHQPVYDLPKHEYNPWQLELFNRLSLVPSNRKVIFVVDYVGNSGKTWFAKHYMSIKSNVQLLKFGKHSDMAYALESCVTTLFLNCSRHQTEYLNYSFLEDVKDGLVFSTKYESLMKTLGPCHVVVLMNNYPDSTKLSVDRYDILDISLIK